jgi:hypothetical protein
MTHAPRRAREPPLGEAHAAEIETIGILSARKQSLRKHDPGEHR